MKQKKDDSEPIQNIVTKEESAWQSIAEGLDVSNEYIDSSSHSK